MYFCLNNFIRPDVVNIFTDASITQLVNGNTAGCYGAIVTNNGRIIDKEYKVCTDSTSNNSEIKAIRLGVNLAIKWRNSVNFPIVINLFSDSQISILGVRDRIFNWNIKKDNLVGCGNSPIKNQSVFIEIINLIVKTNLIINFYHQKAHVRINNYEELNNAIHVFISSNYVREEIDPEFIKYISTMNNMVDRVSRRTLNRYHNLSEHNIQDALIFSPFNHIDKLKQFNELQGSKYLL